jgi:hypothetical protein
MSARGYLLCHITKNEFYSNVSQLLHYSCRRFDPNINGLLAFVRVCEGCEGIARFRSLRGVDSVQELGNVRRIASVADALPHTRNLSPEVVYRKNARSLT